MTGEYAPALRRKDWAVDGSVLLETFAALCLVLALIGGLAMAARRLGLAPRHGGVAGRRLSLVETTALDPRRRLVLVRRDDVEHLILVGPEGARIVERGITRPRFAAPPALETADVP